MASVLYTKARPLPVKSPERKEWLKKAIAAYHRTLAIDSEDVAAHYGLGLAFGDPAWGPKKVERPRQTPASRRPWIPTSCSSWRPWSPIGRWHRPVGRSGPSSSRAWW